MSSMGKLPVGHHSQAEFAQALKRSWEMDLSVQELTALRECTFLPVWQTAGRYKAACKILNRPLYERALRKRGVFRP